MTTDRDDDELEAYEEEEAEPLPDLNPVDAHAHAQAQDRAGSNHHVDSERDGDDGCDAEPDFLKRILDELAAEQRFRHKRYGTDRLVQLAKHCDLDEVLPLNRIWGLTKVALHSFLKRYGENPWMQDQHFYLAKAAIAAAHQRMSVWQHSGDWCAFRLSRFNGDNFLNCGWARKNKQGGSFFFQCRQPEYCPACNRWLRVEPAKKEFLSAFGSAPLWYGVTVMARSNPAKAGVRMWVGKDDLGQDIYEPLIMLSDIVDWLRLPKYDSQCTAPGLVVSGLYEFLKWLIPGHYFDGLHLAGENSFTYYPDPLSPVGVSHTINPHIHGYGNTSRPIDLRRAAFILKAAVQILHREGGNRLWAYPDIAFRPIPTQGELAKAINYVFKPWPFAQHYIRALSRGCPVEGLNLEFHTTYFDSNALLHPFPSPSGISKYGAKFGNMSERAGDDYIGTPLPRLMSATQVKRFHERVERGEEYGWEYLRYFQHLEIDARIKKRRARQKVREMEAELLPA